MKSDSFFLPVQTKSGDPTLSLAIACSLPFIALMLWLGIPQPGIQESERLIRFATVNAWPLSVLVGALTFNLIWLGSRLHRRLGISGQGAKLSKLAPIEKRHSVRFKVVVPFLAIATFGCTLCVRSLLQIEEIWLLPFPLDPFHWTAALSCMMSVACLGGYLAAERLLKKVPWPRSSGLPHIPVLRDGIVLGAIHEREPDPTRDLRGLDDEGRPHRPGWVYQGLKGLTGNLYISGSIGSGKSQVLLQVLRQILMNFEKRPALLAIDPKRTFVRELRKIVDALGMTEQLVWITLSPDLDNSVPFRFNPIWREGMLRNSAFTSIANTLKLASINFIGSSGDSRFWEQSSFNLLKNSLIFCAAKYDYFTFKELYRALVQARDEGLAAELVDVLNSKDWEDEERSNIEMAIAYFRDEFAQMDQKIRTSILATATGFLNEFLEYRVSRLFSPSREEISFDSMKVALRSGRLICLNIENDALARSIGTLLKLLFQEAVLERVTDPDHESARYAVLVMDEFQDVVTSGGGAGLGDDRFLAKARESKAITIAATQSVSSLENAIRNEAATRELLQNFRSRVFGNSTDPKTIRLFQDPNGTEERKRSSRSLSENSQDARPDLLFGGFDAHRSNITESVSFHSTPEYAVTAREFSRLRPFEAFAQIFDGLETRFEKLFLKPYFLKSMRTPHVQLLTEMRNQMRIPGLSVKIGLLGALIVGAGCSDLARADVLFPNICSVVKTSEFRSCLDFSVSACMCGWPVPRPCAQISYNVPQTFLEVWPHSKDSFFSTIPGAAAQLKAHFSDQSTPFGADDEQGSYAFQVRSIPVPFAGLTLMPLPCGGTRIDKPCFDLLSEDLGSNWRDGKADLLQPSFLAWGLAPKACLLKGAGSGLVGGVTPSIGADTGGCSSPLGMIPRYPPSPRDACSGWGLFFPRSGIYDGGSRSAAALMTAARLKSIGVEVTHTVPGDPSETWQMIYPRSSSCFKEGQNLGLLESVKGVREEKRIMGRPEGYLFSVWKRVSCCRDIPEVATALAAIEAVRLACEGM